MNIIDAILPNNLILQILIISAYLFVIFYALGRIAQNYFSFQKTNYMFAIPIGFSLYLLITQAFYFVAIFIGLNGALLNIFETLKNLIIIALIIAFYREWINFTRPSISFLFKAPLFILFIGLSLAVYFLMSTYIPSFAPVNEEFVNEINDIGITNIFATSGTLNPIAITMQKYESFFYWIFISTTHLNLISTKTFLSTVLPIIVVLVIQLTIMGTYVDSEKSIISIIFSGLIGILIIIALGFISTPFTGMFYLFPLSLLAISFLSLYSMQRSPNNTPIIFSIIVSISFQPVSQWSIILFLIFGTTALLLSILRSGNIVRNALIFFSIFFTLVILLEVLFLIDNFKELAGLITYSIFFFLAIAFIIVPLQSLAFSSGRRQDLVSFERKTSERIYSVVLILALLLMLLFSIADLTLNTSLINIKQYFTSINSKTFISVPIYVLFILIPVIIISICKYFGFETTLLSTFAFINIIFNPITLPAFCNLVGSKVEILIIIAPSGILVGSWVVGSIIKAVPQSMRL